VVHTVALSAGGCGLGCGGGQRHVGLSWDRGREGRGGGGGRVVVHPLVGIGQRGGRPCKVTLPLGLVGTEMLGSGCAQVVAVGRGHVAVLDRRRRCPCAVVACGEGGPPWFSGPPAVMAQCIPVAVTDAIAVSFLSYEGLVMVSDGQSSVS
jgi:hypothetical protein